MKNPLAKLRRIDPLPPWAAVLIGVAVFFSLSAAFAYLPKSIYLYDDWMIFYSAARDVLQGLNPVGKFFYFGYYYNPPWLALALVPLAVFGFRFGAGMLATATLFTTLALCRRYQVSLVKTVLVVASPIVYYLILHGQVDGYVLAGIFLPVSFWPLVALAKPQTSLALGLKVLEKEHFKKAVVLSGAVFLLSLLVFGLWPLDLIEKEVAIQAYHNFWRGTWPWNLIPGIVLVFFWIRTRDERLLLSASPFFSPYAGMNCFLGVWIALHTRLKDWQAALLFFAAWLFALLTVLNPARVTWE